MDFETTLQALEDYRELPAWKDVDVENSSTLTVDKGKRLRIVVKDTGCPDPIGWWQ